MSIEDAHIVTATLAFCFVGVQFSRPSSSGIRSKLRFLAAAHISLVSLINCGKTKNKIVSTGSIFNIIQKNVFKIYIYISNWERRSMSDAVVKVIDFLTSRLCSFFTMLRRSEPGGPKASLWSTWNPAMNSTTHREIARRVPFILLNVFSD